MVLKLTFITGIEDALGVEIEPNITLKEGGFLEYRYQQDETVGVFRINIK